ncbi:DUF1572 family protein [Hymenobacter rubripertinctus]|uniref:DUF1572 domain-containing protein n=1 Tax=Hymenobacter rubripertinctus TaxID=2029981 RepID=A0A418R069_9BACT|nr:DUF1572 family protein [Hymenobacter rubripertinctus]RIY10826.1 DUF1572 domain-containing protein [Hymenobacter rubripertinctus]
MPTSDELGRTLLASFRTTFRSYQTLADRALAQLSPADWLHVPGPESNSVAVIVQHMTGNLRSRFTDFLTTDGEKPTRHRDQEFEQPTPAAVAGLHHQWAAAWQVLFDLLDHQLRPEDLLRTVRIRGEAHTVLAALQRQVAHYAYHTGQLVQAAKQLRGAQWQNLSVPRGQSDLFTSTLRAQANQS